MVCFSTVFSQARFVEGSAHSHVSSKARLLEALSAQSGHDDFEGGVAICVSPFECLLSGCVTQSAPDVVFGFMVV